MKISAVVIAKNEENMIADCLDSLSFCDEIIIVDNNSTDRTAEIAKRMGAKVFEFKSNDFAAMRNFGLNKASGDWILYVDTDERVSPEMESNVKRQVLSIGTRISAFKIKRKNFYLGNHEWPYVEKLERLFKKENLKGWKGKLHESPVVEGEIGELDGFLLHYAHRELSSMVNKTIEWSTIEADLRFKSGHPRMTWWRFPRVMLGAFSDSYIKQEGWKAGTIGIIESIYQAFSIFITYAKLWEMQNKSKIENEK